MNIAPSLASWCEGLVFLLASAVLFTVGAGLVEAPVSGLIGLGLDLTGASFFVGAASAFTVALNDFRTSSAPVFALLGRKSWRHRPTQTGGD